MSENYEIKWKIDAYTAETMPLDRLASYLTELVALLANTKHLHLMRVESGSTIPVLKVDKDRLDAIRKRGEDIKAGIAPRSAMESYKRINNLLKEDNASATLFETDGRKTAEIIMFPGSGEPPALLKGVQQPGKVDGRLQRIGGSKEWVPIQLRTLEGDMITHCYAKRDLAKEIGKYLFEPVRLYGRGTWSLSGEGHWSMDSFYVDTFDPLPQQSLLEVVSALRSVKADWIDDPIGDILREADEQ